MENLLGKLYYDVSSPVAYSGLSKIYKAAKEKDATIRLSDVKKWLKNSIHTLCTNLKDVNI